MPGKLVPLLIFAATVAAADGVDTDERTLPDGSRVLRQAIVVDAPVEQVWAVFTTSDGWESWAVPFAHVDLQVGGLIETSYDPSARRGDPGNIRNRVLSYLPYRMLSIQAVQAPPGFEYADLLPTLHSVIELEPLEGGRTRVAISGVGYRDGEGYDRLLEFFSRGNAWTFKRLARRFEEGPLEWKAEPPRSSPEEDAAKDNNAAKDNKRKY